MIGNLVSVLGKISESIGGMPNAAPVNRRVVKVIQNFFKADVCMVFEFDPERDALVLVTSSGVGRKELGTLAFRPGEGIVGSSYKLRSIINLSNSEEHPGFKYVPADGEADFQSKLAVPLVTSGKKIGVMLLIRRQEKIFTGQEVSLARSLAPQLANLIVSSGVLRNLKARSAGSAKSKRRNSSKLAGIPVSPGVVYGTAMKYKTREINPESEHCTVECIEGELKLLDAAIEMTRENTLEFEKRALTLLSEADASIFNAHLLFLDDKMVMDSIRRDIGEYAHTVEFSTALVYRRFEKKFIQLEDNAFRERLIDFKDVMLRLIESARTLRRKKRSSRRRKSKVGKVILVANELMPSDLLKLSFDNVVGIVCETGGLTSHVAILAKAFEIPALLGVKGAVHRIAADDKLVVDAHAGTLYVNPDAKLSDHYDAVINGSNEELDHLTETVMTDGTKVELKANISLLCETPLLKKYHADGIGLYRTEFMFMLRDYLPDEDIQYDVYHKVFSAADGEVTVRVLDAGSDKQINCLNIPRSVNPALGPRGTRVLLENPEFFQTHLRAILRAGENGRLKILFPMVTTLKEIRNVKLVLDDVVSELERDKIPFCSDYRIGVMLEVPSVYLSLDSFLKEVDFISVGTNDLLQYSYAIDRLQNENEFSDTNLEPGFLRMLGETARKTAALPDKSLTVCGEIASHPLAVPVLLGGGVESFSLPPKLIPSIRRIVTHFSMDECREYYRRAAEMSLAEEVIMMMSQAMAGKGLEKYAAALARW
jgi:phosphotransferase system enzyme I (PtsP)